MQGRLEFFSIFHLLDSTFLCSPWQTEARLVRNLDSEPQIHFGRQSGPRYPFRTDKKDHVPQT